MLLLRLHVCLSFLTISTYATSLSDKGFRSACRTQSAGGHAECVEGIIQVSAATTNRRLNVTPPKNNEAAALLLSQLYSPNSNLSMTADLGPAPVSGVYEIFGRLCVPKVGRPKDSVQFLTHGGTLDLTYWDFGPENSYVDQAAQRGMSTFSYDRLGTGRSQHPDGIQITQIPIQVEIGHAIVTSLKSGQFGGLKFDHVVGVGHSQGSAITQDIERLHPGDFALLLLTGHSAYFDALILGLAAAALQIANTLADTNKQFLGLDNGYLTQAPVPQSVSFAYFRYPYYDEQIFQRYFATRQTTSIGESLTSFPAYTPAANYTGAVAIMNGVDDFFFCGGDCLRPQNLAQVALGELFPAASKQSTTVLFPRCGHSINLQLHARQHIGEMLDFIHANGY